MTEHMKIAVSFAAAVGMAGVLSAQTPSQPQTPPRPQTPTTQPTPRGEQPMTDVMTISGCLKAEKDVPGLTPNVAERAGVGEDYVLTNVRMSETERSGSAAGSTPRSGSAPTTGHAMPAMYKITGIDKDELQKHVNHHVQLQGKLKEDTTSSRDRTGASTTDRTGTPTAGTGASGTSGPDKALKEFEATSLKMIAATCPGT